VAWAFKLPARHPSLAAIGVATATAAAAVAVVAS